MDLQVNNISHTYGDLAVLDTVDFTAGGGEIVCIVGISGCDKSTLLRFIGGLERPDSGEVMLLGEPPKESLNPLTYIFKDFALFFPTVIATYSGVDNVDRNLIRMGQSFCLSWLSFVRKIIIPGALPAILSGFRISVSIGIILLVAAEMIGAEYGSAPMKFSALPHKT